MTLTSPAPWPLALLVALGVLAAACEVPVVESPPQPDAAAAAPTDAAAEVDAGPTFLSCHPSTAAEDCPTGWLCEATARVCVQCLATTTRCGDAETVETCEKPQILGIGEVAGGSFEPSPCPSLQACVELGAGAECRDVICQDGALSCSDATTTSTCGANGTQVFEKPCANGWACYSGECALVRHNVLMIFDTSGSMHAYADGSGHIDKCEEEGTACYEDFPWCDDPQDPLTLFTLAKGAFHANIQQAIGTHTQFALQRFTQREQIRDDNTLNCKSGHYTPGDLMSGDDGSHLTAPGGWYDEHLGEVLVVPFPPRNTVDNTEQLLSWLDSDEQIGPSGKSCVSGHDCPAGQACWAVPGGGSQCYTHTQPELRATGTTRIGKALFYAGEYFRRFVLVDGKPCATSDDCGASGYVCADGGVCRDPYAECRENHIILFSDGEELQDDLSPAKADEFFDPVVQAKRLAFGLGCEVDEDCREEAICDAEQTGACYTAEFGGDFPTGFVDPEGYDALSRVDGTPISIRTSVMQIRAANVGAGAQINADIALAGGGAYVDVSTADPAEVQGQLYELMVPAFKCEPDEL